MSGWQTVRLIAAREVRQRARSKLFVWTSAGIGALLAALAALPALLGTFDLDRDPPTDVAVEPTVVAVAGELQPTEDTVLRQVLGEVEVQPVEDADAAAAAVVAGDASLGLVPGEAVLTAPSGGLFDLGADEAVRLADALALALAAERAGAEDPAALLDVPPLAVERVGDDQDPVEATARLVVANVGVVFLFAVLIMYSSMIINGVIEEKGSRVVELLVEAVPTRQLMAGKVAGLGLVGLAQTTVIFGPAAVVLVVAARDVVPPGVGALVGLILLWFVLGYALYAVVAAGFGALVSRPEEAQAVLVPANVLMIAGYFVGFAAVQAPDATFARVAGWLPPSAPYVMLVRQTLGEPTPVEVAGAIVLMLVAIVGATALAARLYRGGILRVGARVPLRDAWRSAGSR
jgi:ABC-2 type transport system permease protein